MTLRSYIENIWHIKQFDNNFRPQSAFQPQSAVCILNVRFLDRLDHAMIDITVQVLTQMLLTSHQDISQIFATIINP